MQISGWGRIPAIDAEVFRPRTTSALTAHLAGRSASLIARGMGRSYGDAALARHVVDLRAHDHLIAFDEHAGIVECGAGVLLSSLLAVCLPRGWFLPVTPGTGLTTVGGALAADVHGKNHHVDGAFSAHVESFRLMGADGMVRRCAPEAHAELFRATAGGMGLTGIVLDLRLRLRRVAGGWIRERLIKTADLEETLAVLDANARSTYAVSWVDVNRARDHRGRGLVMLGEHDDDPLPEVRARRVPAVPFDLSPVCLARPVVTLFNALYYHRRRARASDRRVHYRPYFYPLDGLGDWNRLYGAAGLVQHQSVVPNAAGRAALAALMEAVVASGEHSPLAVLKGLGKANGSPLSFPREGYTLTMDFRRSAASVELVRRLDDIVLAHGGSLYLAKDACMSHATFRRAYPEWEEFQAVRQRYGALGRFASLQSARLGL